MVCMFSPSRVLLFLANSHLPFDRFSRVIDKKRITPSGAETLCFSTYLLHLLRFQPERPVTFACSNSYHQDADRQFFGPGAFAPVGSEGPDFDVLQPDRECV